MKIRLCVLIAAVGITSAAFSEPILITGRVLDDSLRPIENVSVSLPTLGINGTTGSDGTFILSNGEGVHGRLIHEPRGSLMSISGNRLRLNVNEHAVRARVEVFSMLGSQMSIILDTIGSGYTVTLGFQPTVQPGASNMTTYTSLQGPTVTMTRSLTGTATIWAILTGYGSTAASNTATVSRSGTSVTFIGDRPLVKYQLWGAQRALSPEPFVGLSVSPGSTATWTNRIVFAGGRLPLSTNI